MVISKALQDEILIGWKKVRIRSTHKKGSKKYLDNKRGLFITSILGKFLERVVMKRQDGKLHIPECQCGGKKGRSYTDHLFTLYRLIEYNMYLKQDFYTIFLDAEKCFDKLWLRSCLVSLWESGMAPEYIEVIKDMNTDTEIEVHTPYGKAGSFKTEEIVMQGTVSGPVLCASETAKINETGEVIITTIGPNVKLDSRVFVDDINGSGSWSNIQRIVQACKIYEETKKFTFSTKPEKTAFMKHECVTRNQGAENESLVLKRGNIQKVKAYPCLGDIVESNGSKMKTIEERLCKAKAMMGYIKKWGSPKEVGVYAMEVQLLLYRTMVIPSITANAETWSSLKKKETNKMEQIQKRCLSEILGQKISTSYKGILIETGIWPVSNVVDYKRFMLYHNLLLSDESRDATRVLRAMWHKEIEGSWVEVVKEKGRLYGIDVESTEKYKKSDWKKFVKQRISQYITKDMEEERKSKEKLRFCESRTDFPQEYLIHMKYSDAQLFLQTKLNMLDVKCNYGGKSERCPMCFDETDSTEHVGSCGYVDKQTRRYKGDFVEDIRSTDTEKLQSVIGRVKEVLMIRCKRELKTEEQALESEEMEQ